MCGNVDKRCKICNTRTRARGFGPALKWRFRNGSAAQESTLCFRSRPLQAGRKLLQGGLSEYPAGAVLLTAGQRSLCTAPTRSGCYKGVAMSNDYPWRTLTTTLCPAALPRWWGFLCRTHGWEEARAVWQVRRVSSGNVARRAVGANAGRPTPVAKCFKRASVALHS
jgi:hypothetical protein